MIIIMHNTIYNIVISVTPLVIVGISAGSAYDYYALENAL